MVKVIFILIGTIIPWMAQAEDFVNPQFGRPMTLKGSDAKTYYRHTSEGTDYYNDKHELRSQRKCELRENTQDHILYYCPSENPYEYHYEKVELCYEGEDKVLVILKVTRYNKNSLHPKNLYEFPADVSDVERKKLMDIYDSPKGPTEYFVNKLFYEEMHEYSLKYPSQKVIRPHEMADHMNGEVWKHSCKLIENDMDHLYVKCRIVYEDSKPYNEYKYFKIMPDNLLKSVYRVEITSTDEDGRWNSIEPYHIKAKKSDDMPVIEWYEKTLKKK